MLNCGDFQVHTNNQPNNARIFKTVKLSECTYPLTIASNTNTQYILLIANPLYTRYIPSIAIVSYIIFPLLTNHWLLGKGCVYVSITKSQLFQDRRYLVRWSLNRGEMTNNCWEDLSIDMHWCLSLWFSSIFFYMMCCECCFNNLSINNSQWVKG